MPVTSFPDKPDAGALSRRRWTRDECQRLVILGLLVVGKFELIEGDIIEQVRPNEAHIFCCNQVFRGLTTAFGPDLVRLPGPLVIDDFNEPELDAAVTTHPQREYLTLGTPQPADVRLAVEVSHSTLHADLVVKANLYARAGIPEYWVLDLEGRGLVVHRAPTAMGYGDVQTYADSESVSPWAAPGASLPVAEMLP